MFISKLIHIQLTLDKNYPYSKLLVSNISILVREIIEQNRIPLVIAKLLNSTKTLLSCGWILSRMLSIHEYKFWIKSFWRLHCKLWGYKYIFKNTQKFKSLILFLMIQYSYSYVQYLKNVYVNASTFDQLFLLLTASILEYFHNMREKTHYTFIKTKPRSAQTCSSDQ